MTASINLLTAVNADQRRTYWRAFNEAHLCAYRARCAVEPVLASYYAAFARESFAYAKALRTGDWSLTPIRPLSHFVSVL